MPDLEDLTGPLIQMGTMLVENDEPIEPHVVLHTNARGNKDEPFIQAVLGDRVASVEDLIIALGTFASICMSIHPVSAVSFVCGGGSTVRELPKEQEVPTPEEWELQQSIIVYEAKPKLVKLTIVPYGRDDDGEVTWLAPIETSTEDAEGVDDPIASMLRLVFEKASAAMYTMEKTLAMGMELFQSRGIDRKAILNSVLAVFAENYGAQIALNTNFFGDEGEV